MSGNRKKLTLGDTVICRVNPHSNNGSDEAPALVTRVLDVEGEDRVNLRVLMDGDETLRLTNVLVEAKRPELDEDEELPNNGRVAWLR